MLLVLPVSQSTWALPTGIAMMVWVIVLFAWATQLIVKALNQQEFALMLAGCMVCSAAVGLVGVMVVAVNGLPL